MFAMLDATSMQIFHLNTQSRGLMLKALDYEMDIGIEVHVQLKTKSKIFCTTSNGSCTEPNSQLCPICAGHPGVLPVLNGAVVKAALQAALATYSTVTPESFFARKHYFYPDLPKNYQITQSDKPFCTEGYVPIRLEDGSKKNIRLIRIHIEEDAGKNIHAPQSNESFVDLNRAGTPLLEIVSYPDIKSAEEARAYLKALRALVMYLDISTGNMEEGAFRADTNVSVRKKGQKELGTRCELKNINSFKFISDAIEYEVERQIAIIESGQKVNQETRSWNTKEQKTFPLRSKEEAPDYRYFPDPDLAYIAITPQEIEKAHKELPELPDAKFERLSRDYGLTAYEADILVYDKPLADYYEEATRYTKSKHLINWVLRDILKLAKDAKVELKELLVTPRLLAELVTLLDQDIINNRVAQEVFDEIAKTGKSPEEIVEEKGLKQVGSTEELEAIIKEIIEANPQNVAAYKSGKDKLFGFFVGQAMKKTQGKGNPHIINELIKKYLS